jgi:hypothetical protein
MLLSYYELQSYFLFFLIGITILWVTDQIPLFSGDLHISTFNTFLLDQEVEMGYGDLIQMVD